MSLKKQLGIIAICLLSIGTMALQLDIKKWRTQSANDKSGIVTIQNSQIKLVRTNNYPNKSMLRAYQDINVTAGTVYQLSYEIKVKGFNGGGGATVYFGNKAGLWDNKKRAYAKNMRQCGFTNVKLIITGDNIAKLRIDLRAFGKDTKVTYRNIRLEALKKQKDIILTPTNNELEFDGSLNDPLWKNAAKFAPFMILGNLGKTPSVRSSALLAVKGAYLYVAYKLEEPNITGMKVSTMANVSEMENPIRIAQDDCVETFFTVDKKSFSHLIVNPAGIKYWEQINIGTANQTWYPAEKLDFIGDWEAKTSVSKNAWTVEMRIKLSSLFGKNVSGRQILFANFTRHRPRSDEKNHTWAAISGRKYRALNEFPPITLKLPLVKDKQECKDLITPKFTKRFTIPELMLAAKPVKLIRQAGAKFKLGKLIMLDDQTGAITNDVRKLLTKALNVERTGEKIRIILKLQNDFKSSVLTSAELKKLKSTEAFKLQLMPGKAIILGLSNEGILRGIATLILMANRSKFLPDAAIPSLTLYDAPQMPFRAWFISHAKSNMKQMIKLAYLLRFNKIFISMHNFHRPTYFPFKSYPIGSKRYTKQYWIGVFNYARSLGIEPIPVFKPWGRVRYLKTMPGGAKLFVEDASTKKNKPGYRNLDVANPEAVKVVMALQQEIIDTLKPKGFCIGMDEIHWANTVTSAAAKAKKWKPSDWFVNAIKYSYKLFKSNNIKLYIWGDMIDPGYNGKKIDMCGPELLARLPKNIAILDWKYDGKKDYTTDFPSVKMFTDYGFETIGAPWYKTKNTPRMANAVMRHKASGMCLTSWHATQVDQLKPELIRSLGLMSYYSWSPGDCNLENLSILPDISVHAAAYWNKVDYSAKSVSAIKYDKSLVSGDKLTKLIGFPTGNKLDFIATPFKNYRGVTFEVFKQTGQPAAVVVSGNKKNYLGMVRNSEFSHGLANWRISNSTDGTISVKQKILKIKAPSDKTFMRIFQDIRLDPTKDYSLRYRAKIKGSGHGRIWVYMGDNKFKWDSSKNFADNITNSEWESGEIKLPAKKGTVRISINAHGNDTTAWFDNIELVVVGSSGKSSIPEAQHTIQINSKAKVVTFMHATNSQDIIEDVYAMSKKFQDIIPGKYTVIYDDQSKINIPLAYRENICAVNDNTLGFGIDFGLFGTIGKRLFINLPTFTWVNPTPDKIIKSIEIMPGNSKDMSILLFGISID